MPGQVNTAMVGALARRDLRMYFSSPSGYVFITLFIFLSAAAAFWQDRFFLRNLANLDQLNLWLPYLLLFFVPALTMGVWSEEKKQGTDELLLTLPATDVEIVLGKYLAVLGVYSASVALSLSYVAVLFYLGSPDLGLMLSNYLGYWFVGAALIAVGMLASLLTRNATIAFIVGALFCAALIVTGAAVGALLPGLERPLEALSVYIHFDDFAKGIISLSSLVYFAAVGAFFLYLNVLVLSRRHWPARADGYPMWAHHLVRAVAIGVALVSLGVIASRLSVRVDVTAEQLHSLSGETRELLAELPEDRPVFIQAFISPEVPEPFVQTRSNLVSILEEIDALGGSRVEVLIQDTQPFTDAAREARETFGILPRPIRNVSTARSEVEEVFLGVAFTCGAEEQVIGFFDVGLPAEYEIMRSIRVVARTARKRVGVVATMANLFGGMNFQQSQFTPQWSVVTELRKQYDVVEISPEQPITQDVDALLVPLPSSLQTDEQGFVADYIRSGKPALILVDPLPAVNPTLSPTEWVGDGNPFTYPPGQPRPGPRGNVRQWLMDLGVAWEPTRVLWDSYNPHPELAHMPEDVVFLGPGNENPDTFNPGSPMTAQLQELVFLFAGSLDAVEDARYEFEPLLRTGMASGSNGYFSLVRSTFFGPQVNPNPPRQPDPDDHVIAARVRFAGGAPAAEVGGEGESAEAGGAEEAADPEGAATAAEDAGSGEAGSEAAEAGESEPQDAGATAAASAQAEGADAAVAGEDEAASDESDQETVPAAESESEQRGADAAGESDPGETAAPAAEQPSGRDTSEAAEPPAAGNEPTGSREAAAAGEGEPEAASPVAAAEPAGPPRTAEPAPPAATVEPAGEPDQEGAVVPEGAADGEAQAEGEPAAAGSGEAQAAGPEAAEPEPTATRAEGAPADGEAAAEAETAGATEAEVVAQADSEAATEAEAVAEADSPAAANAEEDAPEPAGPVDVIVVADLDFVSEQFFAIRQQAPGGLTFDNITFFLNAMDTLLEDDSFIDLRSRRARHRTLERVEARTAEFIAQRTADEQAAEDEAEQALNDAQARLNDRVAELQARTDIDAQTKQIMVRNLEEVENRRLEVLSTNINTDKDVKIQAGREEMEAQIRQIQTSIKTFAILLPPVPVMVLGAWVFVRRQRREREGAAAARRLRE
ncbi:MAG: Gldg family protein [Acidobacteria bacterium]|nr:Gldg family protein [Acidobacteriota bacterium]